MNGNNTCASAITTPVSVRISANPASATPSGCRICASRPLRPSTTSQPKVRITTLVSSGVITSTLIHNARRGEPRAAM